MIIQQIYKEKDSDGKRVSERWRHWERRRERGREREERERERERGGERGGGLWRLEMAVISPRFPRGLRKRRLCVLTTGRCQEFCVCLCVYVGVSFLLQCALAWCLSTNTSLHCTFRWETQAWRRREQEEEEKEVHQGFSGWSKKAGSYTMLSGNKCQYTGCLYQTILILGVVGWKYSLFMAIPHRNLIKSRGLIDQGIRT